ncbi:mucin-5AC-like [Tachysurus vachellii]|uniref:mucin-5AC-like n=1 Tax=Tachysurus vachellii TaxID=175792 RepID=UPI00296ABD72|nr:mucin-5AC-like [Tachysurus vachellii]
MSWTLKRLHLIFIALVLWGNTNGFGVWNRTFVEGWQAVDFNTTGNQNFQLATRVQPFELLARKSANGNAVGGNSESILLTSEVQTAQHDSSFVQSSGGPAHATTNQNQDKAEVSTSKIYWFDSLKAENTDTLLSQTQSAATKKQAYGSQTQSTYEAHSTIPASQSQAQSMGASTLYQVLTSGSYLPPLNQSIPSSSQSLVTTNQITECQNQTSYKPSTTTQVSAGQSVSTSQVQGSYGAEIQRQSLNLPSSAPVWAGQYTSTSQAQSMGASTLYQSLTSGRYLPPLTENIPSSSQSVDSTNQMPGFQQPSTTTQVSVDQAASSLGPSMSASTLYQGLTSGRYLPSLDQRIPSSSESVVSTNQISGFHQPSTTTQVSAGQSVSVSQVQGSYGAETSGHAKWYSILPGQEIQRQSLNLPSSTPVWAGQSMSQAQSMGASTLYQGLTSGRYLPSLDQSIPSSSQSVVSTNQITGFPNQTSYQPSTTTPVAAGQSVSTAQAQSMGASTLYQGLTSGRYLPPLAQSIPSSSQSVVSTNQISGFHQPSTTTQVSAGQSVSVSQVQGSYGAETSGHAKWYSILPGQMIPSSSQVSEIQRQSINLTSSAPVWAGQSTSTSQAQSMGASTLYQGLTSGRYLPPLAQSIPSSSQSVVSTNQITECQNQTSYKPSTTTQVSAGQSVSTSQVQGSYGAEIQRLSLNLTSSAPVWAGQSTSTSQAQSMGASTLYQVLTSGSYLPPLNQSVPTSSQSVVSTNQITGFSNQTPYQPSTTAQVSAGQSVSTAQAQSMAGLTSGRYLPPLTQSIPSSSQSMDSTNLISGFQWSSATTQVSAGQTASTSRAQSIGGSTLYQGITSGSYLPPLNQSVPTSSQSVASTNRITGFSNQTSYQPSTTTQVSAGQSVSVSQVQGSYEAETSGHAKWYSILPGQEIQRQSLNLPSSTPVAAGQSVSTAQAQSMGASTLYQGLTSGRYLPQLTQSVPSSSQSLVSTKQISGFHQPSATTQVSAGQTASTSQAQSMGASTLFQGLTSRRYLPPLAQSVPSSSQSVVSTNQITGFPNQTPYQPSTTTPVAAGQSISTAQAQSMGGLTSGRYLPPLTQSVPTSSQTVDSTNQISGFHQPSATTAVSAGQTVSTAQAQSMGASTLFQGLTSRRYLTSLPQSVPSSSQSVVSTNRISECQNQMTYQPSTTTQDSDSVSTSQGSYGAETSGHVGTNWYASLPGQTIASSSQVSEFQKPSLNPLITKQLWAGQSVSISQAPFQHMLPQ